MRKFFLTIICSAMVLAIALTSCSNPGFPYGGMDVQGDYGSPGNGTGYPTVAQQLAHWQQAAYSFGYFDVVARADEVLYYTKIIHYLNRENITITIRSYDNTRRVLSLNGNRAMFQVQGVNTTLVLENIFLQGHGGNYNSMIIVNQGSELKMKTDSIISGNLGRGVSVRGGVFTMRDNATIAANMSEGVQVLHIPSRFYMLGNAQIHSNFGGMFAADGIVTMENDAQIRNNFRHGGVVITGPHARLFMHDNTSIRNNASSSNIMSAGGVFAQHRSRIYMYNNASISHNWNDSPLGGGGVTLSVDASLNMRGDVVRIDNNTSTRSRGGGVWMDSGYLNISGGTIYGLDGTVSSYFLSTNMNNGLSKSFGISPDVFHHALHKAPRPGHGQAQIDPVARTVDSTGNVTGSLNRSSSGITITVTNYGTAGFWGGVPLP